MNFATVAFGAGPALLVLAMVFKQQSDKIKEAAIPGAANPWSTPALVAMIAGAGSAIAGLVLALV